MRRSRPSNIVRRLGVLALATGLALAAGACTELKRRAYAPADRDEWQQPERVVETLALAPGDRIADLGSGGGYFTFLLADAVGATGRVYAVDVDEGMNEALREDAVAKGYENVEVVLAAPDDPKLAPGSVDLLFTSNTYHHIDDRSAYFRRAAAALAPGGRVAIVEFDESPGWFHGAHSTSPDEIRSEMEAAGYRLVASYEFLERQSFTIFERADGK